jgi:hypothetical protein
MKDIKEIKEIDNEDDNDISLVFMCLFRMLHVEID